MAKICIVRHAYYPQDTHVRRNAEALLLQGHQVSLVCLRDTGQPLKEVISGVTVYRLPVRHYRRGVVRYLFEYTASFSWAFLTISWLYFLKRFDIVEVDSMPDFLVFSSMVPKMMGARIILYLFEAMPEEYANKYHLSNDYWMVRLLAKIEQVAIRYASRVLTTCEAFRQVFVARGAAKDKITVILNVPDESVFLAVQTAHIHPLKKTGFTIITHGTLAEFYGVQVTIRAMLILRERIPDIHLIIAGDGEYMNDLKQLVQDIGVSDLVNFTGWIPQKDVVHLIMNADVGVIAILGSYGEIAVPNKLFEYIALMKPVICSSLRGIRDYFNESSLKFFSPGDTEQLADNIFELYQHPEEGEALSEKAFEIYEKYCWEKASIVYCNVLLGGRNA